jgi:type I restriction enzyme S subunit
LLRATNVERGKINPDNLIRVDPADVPAGRDAFLKAGEIIVVRSGAYTGDSAIVPSEYAGSVAGYDMVVSASDVDCFFLALALLTPYVLFEQLYLLRMRAAQPHLNKEELSETVILVPPRQEQRLIADSMRIASNKIEAGIAIKERQIAALKEYKTSLINAAVTGKIKVI